MLGQGDRYGENGLAGEPAIYPACGGRSEGMIIGDRYQLTEDQAATGLDTATGRQVDIIVYPFHDEEDPWREHLRRVAELRAALDHPRIVPILAVDIRADAAYVASEQLPAERLSALAADAGRDLPTLARWAAEIGEALAAGHAAGLAHGFLSLDAVLIRPDGESMLHWLPGPASLTSPYRPPGATRLAQPSCQDDIYALAALLYGRVAGLDPSGDGPWQHTVASTLRQSIRSGVRASEWCPDLPAIWDEVLARALSPDSGERFQSIHDFVHQLLSVPSEISQPIPPAETIPPPPVSPPPEPVAPPAFVPGPPDRPGWNRRPVVAGILLLALAAASLFALSHLAGGTPARSAALQVPSGLSVSGPRAHPPFPSGSAVTVSWRALPGIHRYAVRVYALSHHRTHQRLLLTQQVSSTRVTMHLPGARTYLYRVSAVDKGTPGPYDPGIHFLITRPLASAPAAPHVASTNPVTLCWSPVKSAVAYRVRVARLVLTTVTTCTHVSLPAGSYRWSVAAVVHGVREYLGRAAYARLVLGP